MGEIVGDTLNLYSVTRSEMGSYMCIAKNGVPPAVSKNIQLNVNFQPQISSEQQVVGAPSGTEITITCIAEASPRPINYWTFGTGERIVPNEKFKMEEEDESSYRFRMSLTIRNLLSAEDFGSFRCVSKNSIGHAEEFIELYEMKTHTTFMLPPLPDSQVVPEYSTHNQDYEDSNNENVPLVISTPTHNQPPNNRDVNKQPWSGNIFV